MARIILKKSSVPMPKPARRSKKVSPDREGQFRLSWKAFGGAVKWGEPERQHRFHETRKWQFDFAWPAVKVAVEIDGGLFQKGPSGHRSIDGVKRDMEKLNAAQLAGWIVLRYHSDDLDKRPQTVVEEVSQAIQSRTKKR